MSYLPCELHCHSVHSDGDYTVCELQKKAIDDHLAIIALTDQDVYKRQVKDFVHRLVLCTVLLQKALVTLK